MLTGPDDYVPSPCQRKCVLDRRREYCTGCDRSLDEIVRWGGMGPDERRAVWKRLGRPVPGTGPD
ncbi:DUF1289 domain-containing protein [Niveispirillum fermenti]|uniref:DUF1289 domain-containing protein n=1 Tax=Niveispirillum fermenti TaxID=1233113 RepID=UPI003A8804D1